MGLRSLDAFTMLLHSHIRRIEPSCAIDCKQRVGDMARTTSQHALRVQPVAPRVSPRTYLTSGESFPGNPPGERSVWPLSTSH